MSMSDWASKATNVLLIGCAIAMTGLVVKREVLGAKVPTGGEPPLEASKIVQNTSSLASGGRWIGEKGAPLTLIEFSDFQCPFCARAANNIEAFRLAHPGKVAVLYHPMPLEQIHQYAVEAAMAAECAGDQGRFEQFHDQLYQGQTQIGTKPWQEFATEAGVPDTAQFMHCVVGQVHADRVAADLKTARDNEFGGTPVFVVSGKVYQGVPPAEQLATWLTNAEK